jgi:uroporphyrin-III C-methyltransferase/precorrin-2 dehydrogenase/sirohydrochlorin ferrochelatase
MHGADPSTPVTVIENVSRPDQRVIATILGDLEPTMTNANLSGPALTFLGLAPRAALAVAETETLTQEAL